MDMNKQPSGSDRWMAEYFPNTLRVTVKVNTYRIKLNMLMSRLKSRVCVYVCVEISYETSSVFPRRSRRKTDSRLLGERQPLTRKPRRLRGNKTNGGREDWAGPPVDSLVGTGRTAAND